MKKSLKTFSRRAAGLEGAEVEAAVEAGLARDVDDDLKLKILFDALLKTLDLPLLIGWRVELFGADLCAFKRTSQGR